MLTHAGQTHKYFVEINATHKKKSTPSAEHNSHYRESLLRLDNLRNKYN